MSDILADVTEILKSRYLAKIPSSVNKKTVSLDLIKRDSGVYEMEQKNFKIKAEAYGSAAYAFNPNTDADLLSSAPTFDEMSIDNQALQAMAFLKDIDMRIKKEGAAADLAIRVKDNIVLSVGRGLNRDLLTPVKGRVGLVNGTVSGSSTITVDTPGTRFLLPGMFITIDGATGTGITSGQCRVNTVDSATQFTVVDDDAAAISGGLTASNNAAIYVRGYANNLDGLATLLVATGTIQGVALATNYWAHAQLDTTAETIDTADLIAKVIDANDFGEVKYALTCRDLWRKVGADLTGLKQLQMANGAQTVELTGGWSGLKMACGNKAIPLIHDGDMVNEAGEVYGVDPDGLTLGRLDEAFLQGSNGYFSKINKRAKWETTYVFYGNFAVKNFRSQVALRNKTV